MARMPVTSWVSCGASCSVHRRLLVAFLPRSLRRKRLRSGGARRSKRECTTVLNEQKNVSVRKWLKGLERQQRHPCGIGRLRSQKSDRTTLRSSQRKSQSRRSLPGCLSRRSLSQHLGESRRSQSPERRLRHHLVKRGRTLQKNTDPRAHEGSALLQPRIGVADPDRRGGHAVHVGVGPLTMEGILHTITEVQSLEGTGGVVLSLQPGPVPVPHQLLAQAMVLSRRQNQRNSKRSLHYWKNWASARTLCSRSATTGLKARRSLRAAQMRAWLPEGKLVTSREELDAGGVTADEVAQRPPLVPEPQYRQKDVDHDQVLHVAGLTGVHPQGIVICSTGGA